MRIKADGLGYREVLRLAEFMKKVAEHGLYNDVAETFGYDLKKDTPYVETECGCYGDEDGFDLA